MPADYVLNALNGPLHLVRVERSYVSAGTLRSSGLLYTIERFILTVDAGAQKVCQPEGTWRLTPIRQARIKKGSIGLPQMRVS